MAEERSSPSFWSPAAFFASDIDPSNWPITAKSRTDAPLSNHSLALHCNKLEKYVSNSHLNVNGSFKCTISSYLRWNAMIFLEGTTPEQIVPAVFRSPWWKEAVRERGVSLKKMAKGLVIIYEWIAPINNECACRQNQFRNTTLAKPTTEISKSREGREGWSVSFQTRITCSQADETL